MQAHSFHDSRDVDWVKFYALSGQTYNIEASNVSVINNVVVELYDSNGITRLAGPQNDTGNGEEETLTCTCTRDDIYFVKLSNASATFGENCKYDLKLYRPIGLLAGFVIGSVKDALTQQVLAEVRIKTDLNQTALSFANDDYLLVHPPGTFTITAEKTGYSSKNTDDVEIREGEETSLNIILNPIDTDNDGLLDGEEDTNHNGRVDPGEKDPNHFGLICLPQVLLLLL